jgi:hypothetical protein
MSLVRCSVITSLRKAHIRVELRTILRRENVRKNRNCCHCLISNLLEKLVWGRTCNGFIFRVKGDFTISCCGNCENGAIIHIKSYELRWKVSNSDTIVLNSK